MQSLLDDEKFQAEIPASSFMMETLGRGTECQKSMVLTYAHTNLAAIHHRVG